MPVLSDQSNLRGHQITTARSTSVPLYLVASLALITLLGFRISRRKQRDCDNSTHQDSHLSKQKFSDAQMMQDSEPSALPEKPNVPKTEAVSRYEQQGHLPTSTLLPETLTEKNSGRAPSKSSSSENLTQSASSHPNLQSHRSRHSHAPISQFPQNFHRPGSISGAAITTSLLHPEPPSPTIALDPTPMRIHTQIPYQPQTKGYHFEEQPQYPGQYMQNEILFVPSPTEYTSFEALYSNFPPPIYHGPNPTSYTSLSSEETSSTASSGSHQTSYSTTDVHTDYPQDPTLPRRRSYNKTFSNGSEMSGEIFVSGINGEGVSGLVNAGTGMPGGQWRRHTRVFGGGVCVACEENENRRLTA